MYHFHRYVPLWNRKDAVIRYVPDIPVSVKDMSALLPKRFRSYNINGFQSRIMAAMGTRPLGIATEWK
jgi:hypothetical protein